MRVGGGRRIPVAIPQASALAVPAPAVVFPGPPDITTIIRPLPDHLLYVRHLAKSWAHVETGAYRRKGTSGGRYEETMAGAKVDTCPRRLFHETSGTPARQSGFSFPALWRCAITYLSVACPPTKDMSFRDDPSLI